MTILARQNNNSKYNNKVGFYYVKHPEKTGGLKVIQFKSKLEKAMMCYCDDNPKILHWIYEPSTPIRYRDYSKYDEKTHGYGKVRRYYIDFLLTIVTPERLLKKVWVEVKSIKETKQPGINASDKDKETWIKNNCKWSAAKKLAESAGAKFLIITEHELGANAKAN